MVLLWIFSSGFSWLQFFYYYFHVSLQFVPYAFYPEACQDFKKRLQEKGVDVRAAPKRLPPCSRFPVFSFKVGQVKVGVLWGDV